jgi:hypothetical protein
MLQIPCSSSDLVTTIEKFVNKADAFLQNHYAGGSDSADIQIVLDAIAALRLDIDRDALEQDFELATERRDLERDCDESFWF